MFKELLACIETFLESNDEIRAMWNVRDIVCWQYGMLGCDILGKWNVRDVGCLGCAVWDVECLLGCWMLIYKIPKLQ